MGNGKPKTFEIERKFKFNETTEFKLTQIGAHYVGCKHIEDDYFDSQNFSLVKRNYWLRRRNCKWELKFNPDPSYVRSNETADQHEETEDQQEIEKLVEEIVGFPISLDSLGPGWNSNIKKPEMETDAPTLFGFCSFVTERKIWKLELDVTIVLDFMVGSDVEYEIGEIEVMVHSVNDAFEAVEKINEIARKLEIKVVKNEVGKMYMFLQKHNPELLEEIKRYLC